MKNTAFKPVENPQLIFSYFKRQWKILVAVAFFGVMFNGNMPYVAILQGKLIDSIIYEQAYGAVLKQGLIFIFAVGSVQLMRFFKRYFVRLFANHTLVDMRLMLYNSIMNKNVAELSKESTGELMVKAVSDVDICVEGMRKVTTEIFDTGVLMSAYAISMAAYDLKITLLACAFIPVAMLLAEYLKGSIVKFSKDFRKQAGKVGSTIYSDVEQILLERVNGIEEKRQGEYFDQLNILEKKAVKATILENSMQPIYNAIAMLGVVFIIYLGGQNVLGGVWTVGMFSAYIAIFIALAAKASKAAKLFNSYQKAKVSWQRIKGYLKPYAIKDRQERPLSGRTCLSVDNLSFSYPDTEEKVIKDISFSAQGGEIIGVTGPVACGKSTLGLALGGLYAYGGSIKLNGVELSDFSQYEVSRRISVLSHTPQLLSESIYANITLGDDGDITPVLNQVSFQKDLETMPEGINTLVGSSGVKLSGGQQARVALARALYHNSPLIILDDPFASVDIKTETEIIENLRLKGENSIIILISHRLSVFPKTDKVIFINGDGKMSQGTHSELLKSCEGYKNIYTLQLGGGEDEK
ncbi:MAG: ABC transporter ATP-binding protein [Oscillospiraceae bacterium]